MKISKERLEKIQEQVALKDRAAFALGVAMVEYELEKLRLTNREVEMTQRERLERLGAVQSEFDGYRDAHMKVVVKASAAQKALGEAALAELGLASKTRVFTIDQSNGEVMELVAGAYVPVEEAA